jgi:phage gpG-like protein
MIHLEIHAEGLAEALEDIQGLNGRLRDLRPAWEALHPIFLQHRAAAFQTQGGSQGAAWPGLKPSTIRRRKGGRGVLQVSERLKQSLTVATHPEHVWMVGQEGILAAGTRVPYARFHQAGSKRMPARPPVAPSTEEWDSYRDAVLHWIMEGKT